jgi:GTP1/Obg family GTP-binding protein
MERENSNRTRIIGLRLTPEEYAKIEKRWKASTCRKLSDYVRHNLFEKPVVSSYRNQSTDDFMAEMSQLRTELNHIGNNFNQAVKRLHTLSQIAEFKSWLIAYEVEKKTLFNKVDEIKKHIQKIAESWLQ